MRGIHGFKGFEFPQGPQGPLPKPNLPSRRNPQAKELAHRFFLRERAAQNGRLQTDLPEIRMSLFRDLPIQRKLILAILGTTTVALVLACAVSILYERRSFRRSLVEEMGAHANVVATNSRS